MAYEFQKEHGFYKKGDVADLGTEIANYLVAMGVVKETKKGAQKEKAEDVSEKSASEGAEKNKSAGPKGAKK